jgi:predicted nucleotidyltransferase
MAELYLFGSRARGEHRPDSDFDVFIYALDDPDETEVEAFVDVLEHYCIENGGNLDLFLYLGDCLASVLCEERRVLLDKWRHIDLQKEATKIDLDWLLNELSKYES